MLLLQLLTQKVLMMMIMMAKMNTADIARRLPLTCGLGLPCSLLLLIKPTTAAFMSATRDRVLRLQRTASPPFIGRMLQHSCKPESEG